MVSSIHAAGSVPAGNWWTQGTWPWISDWMQSPGFAGAVALAALIFTWTLTRSKHKHEAWWEQVEWSLKQATDRDADDEARNMGIEALLDIKENKRLSGSRERRFLEIVGSHLLKEDENPTPPTGRGFLPWEAVRDQFAGRAAPGVDDIIAWLEVNDAARRVAEERRGRHTENKDEEDETDDGSRSS